jgi:hypothetical protein
MSAAVGGGTAVQHGTSTHGNRHVVEYCGVESRISVSREEVNKPLTVIVVDKVTMLLISGQLQIIIIAFDGHWCAESENGRRENVSARLVNLRCIRIIS